VLAGDSMIRDFSMAIQGATESDSSYMRSWIIGQPDEYPLEVGNNKMSEQQNIETIQQMYEAFGRAEVASIVAKLTDDVKWVSHFDTIVPWSGDFSGKTQVPRFFEAIFQSVDVEAFRPSGMGRE
jgi:hypothetical protein